MDDGDTVASEVFEYCMDIWGALALAMTHAYSPQVLILEEEFWHALETSSPQCRRGLAATHGRRAERLS